MSEIAEVIRIFMIIASLSAIMVFGLFVLYTIVCVRKDNKKELESCHKKGIEYYKEIGSYPYLSDGRKAEDVVKEKCKRYSGCFDGFKEE